MPSVPLDEKSVQQLMLSRTLVSVSGPDGEVVGYFAPAMSATEMARKFIGLPDPESVKRQDASGERTYTTAEVKEYLRTLETQG